MGPRWEGESSWVRLTQRCLRGEITHTHTHTHTHTLDLREIKLQCRSRVSLEEIPKGSLQSGTVQICGMFEGGKKTRQLIEQMGGCQRLRVGEMSKLFFCFCFQLKYIEIKE